jgi:hypothetical protein
MTGRTAKPTQPMCCVSIGYLEVVLPADKGLQLVKLLQGAVACDHAYSPDHRRVYQVTGAPEVGYTTITADQIRMPAPAPAKPGRALLGHEPLRIEGPRS